MSDETLISAAPLAPPRPPMDPASGVRTIKLAPHALRERLTAAEDLFVLAHLGIPRVDPATWSLAVDGLVDRPARFDLAALKARPKVEIEAVHQCCGSPLEPRVPTRRAANLRWGGVDLAALLAELKVSLDARFLWAYGLDAGQFAGVPCASYVKDLPLERLDAGGVLLAYELNGAPLPAEHGFPLRLVVPGYYGTNSVKWLWRLELADRRSETLFTTRFYNDAATPEEIAAGGAAHRPVWAVAPESLIVAPAPDAVVARGDPVEVWGWAWSFRGIAAVEVSADGGASFTRATLEPRRGWAWQRFSTLWRPAVPGEARLAARAIEAGGAAQPAEGARNAVHTVPVAVR